MLMVFVVIPRQAVRHLIIMVVIGKIPLSQRNKNQILQKKDIRNSTFSMCRRKEVIDLRIRRSTINLGAKVQEG